MLAPRAHPPAARSRAARSRAARHALIVVALIAVAPIAVIAAGCGGTGADRRSGTGTGGIVVFAAASLTEAFTSVADAFETEHPGTTVTLNFAGSSELAAQLREGAPADVFAAADLATMDALAAAGGTADDPVVFATNRAEIVVAHGNPLGIDAVGDLADPDLVVVTCAPDVPCGSYATRVFERAGVVVPADSLEENVKAVVTKVALGEADAGIAYATDVLAAADDVTGVAIPADANVVAEYPIAVVADAPDPDGAADFVAFVRSDAGRRILTSFGFGS